MIRVASSLVDEVEPDGAVVVLPRLDGDVPHLALPQERQAVVADEGLQCRKERDGGIWYDLQFVTWMMWSKSTFRIWIQSPLFSISYSNIFRIHATSSTKSAPGVYSNRLSVLYLDRFDLIDALIFYCALEALLISDILLTESFLIDTHLQDLASLWFMKENLFSQANIQ